MTHVSELPSCRVCDRETPEDRQRAGWNLSHNVMVGHENGYTDEEYESCVCMDCSIDDDTFTCSSCEKPIRKGGRLITKEGQVYCDPCAKAGAKWLS